MMAWIILQLSKLFRKQTLNGQIRSGYTWEIKYSAFLLQTRACGFICLSLVQVIQWPITNPFILEIRHGPQFRKYADHFPYSIACIQQGVYLKSGHIRKTYTKREAWNSNVLILFWRIKCIYSELKISIQSVFRPLTTSVFGLYASSLCLRKALKTAVIICGVICKQG